MANAPKLALLALLALLPVAASPHRFRVYPHASITILSIAQGPDGFLWLAALDGLYRFDGFHYRKIADYPFESARRIGVTGDGSVWIASQYGLVRYKGRFEVLAREPVVDFTVLPDRVYIKLPPQLARVFALDGSSKASTFPFLSYLTHDPMSGLWVTHTGNRDAIRVDPSDPDTVLEHARLPFWFPQIFRDASGKLHAADTTSAIEIADGNQVAEWTRRPSKQTPRPPALLSGRHGQVWFLGETIRGFSPPIEFRDSALNNQYQPTSGFEDKNGHLWVAKLGLGLIEWIPDSAWNRWSADEFGDLPLSQIAIGKHGTFAATHNNIYRLDGDAWRPIAKQAHHYSAILPLDNGGFLATIRRLGTARLSSSGTVEELLPNPLPSNDDFRFLIRNGAGRTWVGTKRPLLEIIGATASLRLREMPLPEIAQGQRAQPIDMELDRDGKLWVGYAAGVAYLDEQDRFHRIPTSSPIAELRSLTLAGSRNGDEIWVAFRGDRNFARLQKRGEVWVVTECKTADGYLPEDTHFIKRDSRGWIWRGSPEGVHVSDGFHIAPGDWLHFTPRNGLSTRSTDQYGFTEDVTGAVWITGEEGVTRITPSPSWFKRAAIESPRITGIEIDGAEQPVSSILSLPQVTRSLRIEVGSMQTSGLLDRPFRYRLLPSKEWHHSAEGTIATAELPPGEYTLEIQSNGFTPSPSVSFPFRTGTPPASFSWIWFFSVPFGGLFVLFGPWFPWSERVHYRVRKDLFLLRRRFSRHASSSGREPMPSREANGRIVAGRYRLLRSLSRGGFSEVYEAEDMESSGTTVAVKILNAEPANEGWVRDRFAHEIAALRSVEHPAVVRILDSWIGPLGEPCLVMPYLKGPTLREALNKGPISAGETAQIVHELGSAIAEVHAKGIVHRDLKPENVILAGRPVLIDFGTSSLRGRHDELAATTMLSGSFHYMAPERLTGHYSPESDVYSLGVMTLEMLTQQRLGDLPPHSADTFIDRLTATLPAPNAAQIAAAIAKACDPNPLRRPFDVGVWSEDLAALIAPTAD